MAAPDSQFKPVRPPPPGHVYRNLDQRTIVSAEIETLPLPPEQSGHGEMGSSVLPPSYARNPGEIMKETRFHSQTDWSQGKSV